MKTMGQRVAKLEPVHGFAAETTAASILFTTAHFGMPVSTTQVISSAIMGVGASQGARARPLGCRAAHPRRLDPDHPGGRHPRGARLGRPQRPRCAMTSIDLTPALATADWRDPDELPTPAQGPQVLRPVRRPTATTSRPPRRPSTRWSTSTTASRRGWRASRRSRSAATRSTRRSTRRLEDAFITPFDREDIHELVSRLDDVVDGIQSIAETFVIYGVDRSRPRRRRRLAAILDGQGGELAAALRKLDGLKGLERHFDARSTSSRTRPTACRGRRSARLFRERRDSDRGHQVARPLQRAREHHRCRRGRRRGHGADVPQGATDRGRHRQAGRRNT